jgi:fructokinase
MRGPAIGVDLGGTKIEVLLLDAAGRERWRERVATPQGDYAETLSAIAALVQRAERDSGLGAASVGVGSPGSATAAGLMRNANSTCLNGRPLQRDLEALLGRPVALANDANCLALSEATDGAGAGAAVVFAVILGTGVGGGLTVGGRLVTGANGLAGEWGHNPLPWPTADEAVLAPACYCGQRGCIETWLSGPALARDHQARHGGAAVTAEAIAHGAAAGDGDCSASLQRHADRLARALATVINLLDPDVVVLAGGLSRLAGLYMLVPALWSRHTFSAGPEVALRTRLLPSAHGDASGVRGAAWLGREVAAIRV